MAKTTYMVNGDVAVTSVKEVNKILAGMTEDTHVALTKSDIEAGKDDRVYIVGAPVADEVVDGVDGSVVLDHIDGEVDPVEEATDEVEPVADEVVEEAGTEYPEVGHFKTDKELKKYYKKLTDAQLDEWLELEGVEVAISGNEPIDRMRRCMAILFHHFPKEPSKSKKKSKYADYTINQLMQIALDHDVEVPDAKGDLRILRMYAIMALRDAGILD